MRPPCLGAVGFYLGVLDGGPGNDTLLGPDARDRIDVGNGGRPSDNTQATRIVFAA
jgi:hypothetical protein